MTAPFDAAFLAEQLERLQEVAPPPGRYVVAFSGGLDSTVLCHALTVLRQSGRISVPILAIHINHQLQQAAAGWGRACVTAAAAMAIDFRDLDVVVEQDSGRGLEAAARDARYAALRSELQQDDWLLSAHHRDDQAETLLLNLLRGSGPAGLAGIGEIRPFGVGWLARPLLEVDRLALQGYADQQRLHWIDDPSNLDRRFDRNFLRHEVLPVLQSRWPDAASRLQRSAAHAGEAAHLLTELAQMDLVALDAAPERLPIDALLALPAARQRNLIRYAVALLGMPIPTTAQLAKVTDELLPAREDAQPLVAWPGVTVRRYRNALYLLPDDLAPVVGSTPVAGDQTALGKGLGSLQWVRGAAVGLSEALLERGLRIEARIGGEEIKPLGQTYTRKLKKLLQEEGVVPWMRDRLPLVYCGEQLVAVGDLWLSDEAAARPGVAVRWNDRPALH